MEQEQPIVKDGVDILIKPLGPIVVTSKSYIHKPDGTVDVKEKVSLCGCGLSKNKPYCDASHKSLIKEKE
jgi:CDGSH-type Zn-finger protein